MPKPEKFLKSFDLQEDHIYGNYLLTNITITHKTIKRYEEYEYEITLIFQAITKNASLDELYKILEDELSESKIIYGVKNPYLCDISLDSIKEADKSIVVKLTGHAIKHYD